MSTHQLSQETYHTNGYIHSAHQQQQSISQNISASQTSLQKLANSSPQFLYQTSINSQQQQQHQQAADIQQPHHLQHQHMHRQAKHMQFPPPPQMTSLVPQSNNQSTTFVSKGDSTINSINSLLMSQTTQQQNPMNLPMASEMSLPMTSNGMSQTGNLHQQQPNQQPSIVMSPVSASKKSHNNHLQQAPNYQLQQLQSQPQQPVHLQIPGQGSTSHHQQQQQQSIFKPPAQKILHQSQLTPATLSHNANTPQIQQQVPITTITIPAMAAAQLQSAASQIQQAAMQAQGNQSPQILVFMIPYIVNQPPPTIPPTPEQLGFNSTLLRQSFTSASMNQRLNHHQQQIQALQQQPPPPQQQQTQPGPPQQLQQNIQQQQQQHQVSSSSFLANNRAVSSLSGASRAEPEKFYVKSNFTYRARDKNELSFHKGEILHVLDTLQSNDCGLQYWLAARIKSNGKEAEKGLIPNKSKAEEISLEQRTMDIGEAGGTLDSHSGGVLGASVGRVNFLKRRAAQRSKSLCKDNWDNVVFDIGSFKLPTYERVVYKHPGFCRPVVIFGPLSDVAREKLLKDYPEKYSYPTGFNQAPDHPKVIRLKGVLDVIDQGKHALLDITPSAVEKLNYVNLAPIVIFMKTDSKSIIKEFRARAAKSLDPNARDEDTLRRDGRSSRKLLEQSIKLEKMWYHVFTATLDLSTMGSEMWYRKLRETIENQQSANVWMGERKSDKKLASISNSANTSNNEVLFPVSNTSQSNISQPDHTEVLSERFNESVNITRKSALDLLPSDGDYGNRSQLRNAYAHSLAQRLARASSEPKLNGMMPNNEDESDEDDDDNDDEIIKKPFADCENSSSISSSNGATSYGHNSMTGSNMNYQSYSTHSADSEQQQLLNRTISEGIYTTRSALPGSNHVNNCSNNNSSVNSGSNNNQIYNNNGAASSSNGNYHPLPPIATDTAYHSVPNNNNNNNVIDLSRNHEPRGNAFQVYSDMNQNNYHYYNLNKI